MAAKKSRGRVTPKGFRPPGTTTKAERAERATPAPPHHEHGTDRNRLAHPSDDRHSAAPRSGRRGNR